MRILLLFTPWWGFWRECFGVLDFGQRLTGGDVPFLRIGIMSGSFIFRPALEDYWSQHPTADDASSATASEHSSPPLSSTEAPAPATALTRQS